MKSEEGRKDKHIKQKAASWNVAQKFSFMCSGPIVAFKGGSTTFNSGGRQTKPNAGHSIWTRNYLKEAPRGGEACQRQNELGAYCGLIEPLEVAGAEWHAGPLGVSKD